jgi:Flp pilus assembly protein TadG
VKRSTSKQQKGRRGVIAVLTAVLLTVMLAMIAFAIDIGVLCLARTQLQVAADSAALAAAGSSNLSKSDMVKIAQSFAQYYQVAGRSVILNSSDVQFGIWDVGTGAFTQSSSQGTAIKVTVRTSSKSGGETPLFFGRILGKASAAQEASAIAVVNPRDIAFVVDTSGSMNDDSTPGASSAKTSLIQAVYDDFGFGTYPGTSQTLGTGSTASLMNGKLKTTMPNAVPTPNSANADSVKYWAAYFSYLGSSGQIGYKSYVTFMMKQGRDIPVVPEIKNSKGVVTQAAQYTPMSVRNLSYRAHVESTDAGSLSFPPREMPTHAARRAIIAAIKVIQDRNATISDASQKDQVSLIVYDYKVDGTHPDNVRVAKTLTDNYAGVIDACRTLQAADDNGSCTDTEGGLLMAYNHIKPASQGGTGRENVNKVIVLLTDGLPNLYESSNTAISAAMAANPGGWGTGYAQNAALMQAMNMQNQNWTLYPVGVGAGGDQTFMNRLAVKSGTAKDGAGYTVASDASVYESTLRTIFQGIISNPKLRLVQ